MKAPVLNYVHSYFSSAVNFVLIHQDLFPPHIHTYALVGGWCGSQLAVLVRWKLCLIRTTDNEIFSNDLDIFCGYVLERGGNYEVPKVIFLIPGYFSSHFLLPSFFPFSILLPKTAIVIDFYFCHDFSHGQTILRKL